MKKIISLTLMLVFVLLALVSCGGDELTPIPEHYPKNTNTNESVETVTLYIIGGQGTTGENNETTQPIKNLITNKTAAKLNVKLNVVYLSEAEYAETVMAELAAKFDKPVVDPETTPENKFEEQYKDATGEDFETKKFEGAVVLVNSLEFKNQLISSDEFSVVDLSSRLLDKFATLSTVVPRPMIEAAREADGKLYALPNSRTLGEYEYLVINEEIACQSLKFSPSKLASYNTYEATAELRQAMIDNGYDADANVYLTKGTYADKAKIEAAGNVCNVVSVPTVTVEDAFKSSFAIINSGSKDVNDRAMRVINALNQDEEIRNILQYGIEHTNYTVEDGNIVRKSGNDLYDMNYIYTGNAFILEYCKEIGWAKESKENGINQNKDAVFKK